MPRVTTDKTLVSTGQCTVLTPATQGIVKMQLGNAASSAISAGRYFYDLEIHTNADAVVRRLIQGEVTLNPEVTR